MASQDSIATASPAALCAIQNEAKSSTVHGRTIPRPIVRTGTGSKYVIDWRASASRLPATKAVHASAV